MEYFGSGFPFTPDSPRVPAILKEEKALGMNLLHDGKLTSQNGGALEFRVLALHKWTQNTTAVYT